jgi:hypothetical protein
MLASAVMADGLSGTQDPPASQQQPVFRAGTHFVRVDAYPTRDREIITGLTADDFELLEDGQPQQIDSVQFVRFDGLNPLEARRDPNTVGEMYRLAADPANRVFVLYFDTYHVAPETWRFAVPAARSMVDRMLGSRDLVGVLTPAEPPGSLTLGQIVPEFGCRRSPASECRRGARSRPAKRTRSSCQRNGATRCSAICPVWTSGAGGAI